MNPEVKAKWIAALTGGEYRQAREQLRYSNSFCCLGVLCDLYLKDVGDGAAWEGNEFIWSDEGQPSIEAGELPAPVVAWAELKDNNPIINDRELSDWNDHQGYTFPQIAQLIEVSL